MQFHFAAALVAAILFVGPQTVVRSQEAGYVMAEPTTRMVFTEKACFVTGIPATLCSGKTEVYPDPRGRFVLIAQFVGNPNGEGILTRADPESGASRLLLYDSRTSRLKALWEDESARAGTEIRDVAWLPGSGDAVVTIGKPCVSSPSAAKRAPMNDAASETIRFRFDAKTQKLTPTTDKPDGAAQTEPPTNNPLCLLNGSIDVKPATSSPPHQPPKNDIRPLWVTSTDPKAEARLPHAAFRLVLHHDSEPDFEGAAFSIRPSPKLPIAVIQEDRSRKDDQGQHRTTFSDFTVDERGGVEPLIDIDPRCRGTASWSPDGTETYFDKRIWNSDPPGTVREFYSYNLKTRTVARIDSTPANATTMPGKTGWTINGKESDLRLNSGDAIANSPVGGDGKIPIVKPVKLTPLKLVRADGKHEKNLPDSIMITPNADYSCMLADQSAMFYVEDLRVYVVPLTMQPRSAANAAYQKLLQRSAFEHSRTDAL